jgi:plastocyanin
LRWARDAVLPAKVREETTMDSQSKVSRGTAVLIISVLAGASLLGCSKTDNTTSTAGSTAGVTTTTKAPGGSGSPTTAGGSGAAGAVTLKGIAFVPSTLAATAGEKITFTNQDSVTHTVVSDSGTTLKSESLGNGATYSVTISQPGTYAYHCGIHASMKGTITVS